MKLKTLTSMVVALSAGALLAACQVDKAPDSVSGYTFATKDTQAMQDDNFSNPAMLWVGIGEEEWIKKDGSAGKSCASCHGGAKPGSDEEGMYAIDPVLDTSGGATKISMKGVATKYPIFDKASKKPMVLEERINLCRTKNMKAKAWKWESDQMMGTTMLVKMQSRGMPIMSTADQASSPLNGAWKAGMKFFNERRGQMDMACKNCHDDYPGTRIRANMLTQAQVNGFPTFRLKWQKPGTIHRRYAGCNKMVRAKHFKRGSNEYKNLEVYMTWRSRGLKVETPAVRN
ncbi:MAG: sulfur oxidation c-type cytochrome SoxA [Rhodospirillales bacterium]|nr:sulfur oxidation c-type cytochrome SoxA [Rhodospirillales bacterium]